MEESDFSEGNEEGEEIDEEILDPNNPEHELSILERDFNKVVTEIEGNPESAQFAEEYTKLYDTLVKYFEKQRTLQEDNDKLKNTVETNSGKLEAALKLSEIDQHTIQTLKQEIEKAWRLADAAHSREQQAQEVIDNLIKQVETLNEEIAIKSKFQESEEAVDQPSKKDDLEKQTEKFQFEISQLQTQLYNSVQYQDELERKNSEANLKINEIAGQLEDQINEWQMLKAALEKTEEDLRLLRIKVEDKEAVNYSLKQINNEHLKHIAKLEGTIKDQKGTIEKNTRDLEVAEIKRSKQQNENENTVKELDIIKKNLQEKINELKKSESEAAHYKADLLKVTKLKEGLDKIIQTLTIDKENISEDRNKLRARIGIFEKEIDTYKKYADVDKRTIDTISKDKDLLGKAVLKHQNDIKEQEKLIKIQEFSTHKLETELDNLFAEINFQKKKISGLEHEKKRLDEETLILKKTIEENVDEIKLKKVQLTDLQKVIEEQENKFRQQQNLFETVRADRNATQKALQESTAERDELKEKLKIVFHQTEQLKEDISMKEKLFVKEENVLRKAVTENENLKIELDSNLNKIKNLKIEIKEMKEEEKRLHKVLGENENEMKDQKKKIEQLMNERDILGSQLVRRNDEIALLNEKNNILQITLTRGETQYDQRLDDIRLLKLEIKKLRQEKNIWTKSVNGTLDYRKEIFRLERDLTKCRLKCCALEEEVQNPLNLHRWRKLEGTDPDKIQLIEKIKLLQKRLLKQTSESIEIERQLKESEKLYTNLKQIVSNQQSPDVHQELLKTKSALKTRTNKLKALVGELNMVHLKASQYKSDFERVSEELAVMKRKFLEEKRQIRAKNIGITSSQEINHQNQKRESTSDVRSTGGGFRMSVQQISKK